MPHENNEPMENQESMENTEPRPPLPPKGPHKPKCDCGPNCPCRCKHKGAKLVAALIIFFAGFGLAMACRCMKHSDGCPHHYAMMKKQTMMAPNYTDGAGNVIIINTDGSKPIMPKQYRHKNNAAMAQPAAATSKAAMPAMPMVEEDEE